MRISVVIATFNGEKYIEEQLYSILNQIKPPDEIIICDDCSNDHTLIVVHKIQSSTKIPFKIFVNESNIGYTKNFSKAILQASGDLIFISDQDDVWLNNKISNVYDIYIKNFGKHVFINDTFFVDTNLNKTGSTKLQVIKKIYNGDSQFVAGCCTAISGGLIKLFSSVPNEYSYDEWIHYFGSVTNSRFVIDQPLQLYRRHGENTSNVVYNLDNINYIRTFIFRYIQKFNLNKKIKYLNRQLLATLYIRNLFKENDLNDYFKDTIEIENNLDRLIQKINRKLRFYNSNVTKILFFKFSSNKH